jgi:flavin reductase
MTLPQHEADGHQTRGKPFEATPNVEAADFKLAMRQIALPVAVVTARHNEVRMGMTATSVSCVSADPPAMLVCVNRSSSAEQAISESGAFAINMLSDAQHPVARLFSNAKLGSVEPYALSEWQEMVTGAPVLTGAVAVFDCAVESCLISGSHAIYVGRVIGVASLAQDILLDRDGLFRRLQPIT